MYWRVNFLQVVDARSNCWTLNYAVYWNFLCDWAWWLILSQNTNHFFRFVSSQTKIRLDIKTTSITRIYFHGFDLCAIIHMVINHSITFTWGQQLIKACCSCGPKCHSLFCRLNKVKFYSLATFLHILLFAALQLDNFMLQTAMHGRQCVTMCKLIRFDLLIQWNLLAEFEKRDKHWTGKEG